MHRQAFSPVAASDARILILGSLPGVESLERGEYYAKKQNAFWPIMGILFGAGPGLAYADRLAKLIEARVGLWDVCESAFRPGSLDSAIVRASVVTNDFEAFFAAHPDVGLVCFNGGTAARQYQELVVKKLSPATAALRRTLLPSTSPAHARMSLAAKAAVWRDVLADATLKSL